MSLGVGVLGIAVAVLLYLQSRERVRLLYHVRGTSLVDVSPAGLREDVEIHFRGEVVPRVALTSFTVWNAGTATLESSAVAARDPLRIELPDDPLWSHLTATRSVTGVALSESAVDGARRLGLDFDFLDPGDGARVDLMHTGRPEDPTLRGTVKGVGSVERVRAVDDRVLVPRIPWAPRASLVLAVGLLQVVTGAGVLLGLISLEREAFDPRSVAWMLVFLGVIWLAAGGGAYAAPRLRRRAPAALDV